MHKPIDKGKVKIDKYSRLIQLAKEEGFDSITISEKKMFHAVVNGEFADYRAKKQKDNNPANSKDWSKERILNANIITWLCSDLQASNQITRFGIKMKGARIDGELNLQYSKCSFPLFFEKCSFSGSINFKNAELNELCLSGSQTGSINGEGLKVKNSVFMQNGFKAEGRVSLAGASIGGQLECDASQFINPEGDAIFAEGLQVKNSVFLRNGFKAEGRVSLSGASIGGQLDCGSSQFINPKGDAIFAEGLKVKNSVFMQNGFKAKGRVSLVGASIGGQLSCINSQFINPAAFAINAQGLQVNNDVFMRDGFKAEGQVSLAGASIGGQLDCTNGQFINPEGVAINAEGIQVKNSVFMRNGFKAEGQVSLIGAIILDCFVWTGISSPKTVELILNSVKIDSIWDEPKSWPHSDNLSLVGLVYERFFKVAPIDAKNRLNWLRRQPKEPFSPQPYEQLASVLQKSGYEEEAKKILIAKSTDRAKSRKTTITDWLWYHIFGKLIGYGYRSSRAFIISLIVIALGWGIFAVGNKAETIIPTEEWAYISDPDSQRLSLSANYPKFNPLVYSLDVFVPLVDLQIASYWMPNANRQGELLIFRSFKIPVFGWVLRVCMWIHILLGWILTTLWIGALTGLIRK